MRKPKRKPKYTANPFLLFNKVSENQPHPDKEVQRLSLMAWLAVNKIREGKGNACDIDEVVVISNVTRILSEKVGQECVQVCEEARGALASVKQRFDKTGRIGFSGSELTCVRSLIDLYEQFLPLITPREHRDAWDEMWRRIDVAKKQGFL